MTREEYIQELRARIAHLPKEEREAAMSYYIEYLEDASDKSMEEIMMELGTPRDVAERIIADCAQSRKENNENSAGCLVGILALLTSPLWLPVLFVIGVIGFVLLFVSCILIFVFGILAVTLFCAGIWSMFAFPPTGIALVGAGLICAALVILFVMMFVGLGAVVKIIVNTFRSKHRQS